MARDEVHFDSLKEHRGWYYVEYRPPMIECRFSVVQLVVVEPRDTAVVAAALEAEAVVWLKRYPIPLMATAFSADNRVVSLSGVRENNHLMAWFSPGLPEPVLRWELVQDEALPTVALDRERLRGLLVGVPYKKTREIKGELARRAAARRVSWWLVFVWAVPVPLGVALLEWWSDWLGYVVLAYAFVKATLKALRLTGRLPESVHEREKEAEALKMQHHHYHCERNPQAFQRLRAENFRRDEVERTKAESLALKKQDETNID
jgi:hypothetical protein